MVVAVVVVAISSLHPNQPGVLHVVVDEVCFEVVVEIVVVVSSSRQPHHPGVLQVSVRVRLKVLVREMALDVVVRSVPLLSKNSHGKQSVQLIYCSHLAGASYFSRTSRITSTILCVPIPTRQPRSLTVSYTHLLPVWHTLCIA